MTGIVGIEGEALTNNEKKKLLGAKFTPGLIVFSLVGYLGQGGWNIAERWRQENEGKEDSKPKSLLQRMADSKWIPLRALSDEEFRNILKEKVLSLDVEIALLDDKIKSLEDERAATAVLNTTMQKHLQDTQNDTQSK